MRTRRQFFILIKLFVYLNALCFLSKAIAQNALPTQVSVELAPGNLVPLVKATLTYNGVKAEGLFLLSTATDNYNYVSDTLVEKLQLPLEMIQNVEKGGLVAQVQPEAVQLGSFVLGSPLKFLVISDHKLNGTTQLAGGVHLDGILGPPFFQRVPVLFDIGDLHITLFPSSIALTRATLAQYGIKPVAEVPLIPVGSSGQYAVQVRFNDKVSTPLILNTTMSGPTIIPTAIAKQLHLKPTDRVKVGGDSGAYACRAQVKKVAIDSVVFHNVDVGYYDPSPPAWQKATYMYLSWSVLTGLRWLYDVPDKKLCIIGNESKDTSSASTKNYTQEYYMQMSPLRIYVVGEVPQGSRAARAGLREGDRILAIDGRKVSDLTPEEAIRLLHPVAGKTLVLEVLHKGASQPTEIRISIPK